MTRLAAAWLRNRGLAAVWAALGPETLVVGGAVRNGLLGLPPGDIDMAGPLPPEEVVRRLRAARLKAVPTGLDHGTITAVAHGTSIEVTTFRADVETDGRHARVRFSTSAAEDARRRDFTINALYLDRKGTVLDPLGEGLRDLAARRVRFIGDAGSRIREDYLRILRFFRFSALYAGVLDPVGLAACARLAEGVDGLARERMGAEMRKLLAAPAPAATLRPMDAAGVLARVLPGASVDLLGPLEDAERRTDPVPAELADRVGPLPDWRVRLFALSGDDPADALRLSRATQRFLEALGDLLTGPDARRPAAEAWASGPELARAAALIRAARGEPAAAAALPRLHAELARGCRQKLPLAATDLIAAGVPKGPELGAALAAARDAWLASDFTADRTALLRLVAP